MADWDNVKFVPDVAEVTGNLCGSSQFVKDITKKLKTEVRSKKKPSKEEFLQLVHLTEVLADTMENFGKDLRMYDRWLRETFPEKYDKPKYVTKNQFES